MARKMRFGKTKNIKIANIKESYGGLVNGVKQSPS
jgi:hypothetical protein